MKEVNLIFPHQLFQESPIFDVKAPVYLVEEYGSVALINSDSEI
tara:strand:+ start:52 stop:183 length:132 start_codon:yes stop_codon:yes gene_type:complete